MAGVFVPLTTSSGVNFIPASYLLKVFAHSPGGVEMRQQFRGIAYLHPVYSYIGTRQYVLGPAGQSRWLQISIHGIQVMWLAVGLRVACRWRAFTVTTKLLMLAPVVYFLPMIVYNVLVAYPRQIVVAYVAMGMASLYVLSRSGDATSSVSGYRRVETYEADPLPAAIT